MGKRTVSNSNQSYLQRLVESLERIAASADAQIAWMNKTGFPPEEMRVDLIHWSSLVPSLVESRTVSPQAASALEDLREFLDSLFLLDHRWITSDEALRSAPEWAAARTKATQALVLLGGSTLIQPSKRVP